MFENNYWRLSMRNLPVRLIAICLLSSVALAGCASRGSDLIPTVQNIEEYLNKLYDEEVPLTMRRKALVAIRSWFNFLGRGGHIKSNPASPIKNQKLTKHLYRPLTEEQVQSAFASIDDKNSNWPARDRAIFETIY
jgi:site-specific recombinase XerD